MAKQVSGSLLTLFNLDEGKKLPLYRQIYLSMREAILNGNLTYGVRLPSTRTLASDLGVSRNTVMTAFEQLEAESFLECQSGSGSFVAFDHTASTFSNSTKKSDPPTVNQLPAALSERGKAMLAAQTAMALPGAPIPFSPGIPALDLFPHKRWSRCVNRANSRIASAQLNYGPSEGFEGLRKELVSYLATARGVQCTPDQILLISGVQQGLDLIVRMMLDPGDHVWIEEPGHLGARGVFIAGQSTLVPVPVDSEGLMVDRGIEKSKNARLAYVTPSHQSPTGVIMTLQRRMALLDWADKNDSWIVEDDYDSEFRYKGRPLAALQGLRDNARVIYLGTFSKVIAPGLRLGYLVVPEPLRALFTSGRRLLDTHTSIPIQIAMCEFMSQGYFASHIRKMRKAYRERQNILVEEVQKNLNSWVDLEPSPSGMHLVGYLRSQDDDAISRKALEHGINVPALSEYYLETPNEFGLIFGYACVPPEGIKKAISKLGSVLENF